MRHETCDVRCVDKKRADFITKSALFNKNVQKYYFTTNSLSDLVLLPWDTVTR